VKEAAGKLFDKLDKAGDGTLDSKEVGTRVTKADFKAVDVDHDGMLTKDEYFTIVEKLFNAADVDKDGTLSAKELQSKAGLALLRLMQ
jgi:Ca2+-binding EF-hand superfamily protein